MGDFTVPWVYPDLFNVSMNNGIIPDFYAKSVPIAFMLLGMQADERNNYQPNKKDQDFQSTIHIYKGKTKNHRPYYQGINFVSLPMNRKASQIQVVSVAVKKQNVVEK